MTPAKPVLGLIGAIGAGKSTVARLLAERGGAVVDADRLGHEVLDEPSVKAELVTRWGAGVLKPDGTANRRAIGDIVFRSPAERATLEAIVFPRIHARESELFAQADADPAAHFVVLDAAVLLEAGHEARCAKLLFVDAPRELRLERLRERSGWGADELDRREAAQWPLAVKRLRADAVLDNDGTPEVLATRLDDILRRWHWPHAAVGAQDRRRTELSHE